MKSEVKRIVALLLTAVMLLPALGIAEESAPELVATLEPVITEEATIEPEAPLGTLAPIEPMLAAAVAPSSTDNGLDAFMEERGYTIEMLVELTGLTEEELRSASPEVLEEIDAAIRNQNNTATPAPTDSNVLDRFMEEHGYTLDMLIDCTGMTEEELRSAPIEVLEEIDAAIQNQSTAQPTAAPATAPTAEELAAEYGITVAQLAKLFEMSVSELSSLSPESMLELAAVMAAMAEQYATVDDLAADMGVTVSQLAEAAGLNEEQLRTMTPIQVMVLIVDKNVEPTYRFQTIYELANWYGLSLNELAVLLNIGTYALQYATPGELEAYDAKLREMGITPNYSIKTAQQLADKYGMSVSDIAALYGFTEAELNALSPAALYELDAAMKEAGLKPHYKYTTAQELAEKYGLTLAQVAERTGYSVEELLAMTPDRLGELDELLAQNPVEPEYKFQSAWELAVYFNLTIDELAAKAGVTVSELEKMPPAQLHEIYELLLSTEVSKGFQIKDGVLTAYTGEDSNIIIPETVTEIAVDAFRNSSIVTVKLPSTLTKIGAYAFCDCDMLTEIYIPDNVTSIGEYAFGNCDSLLSVRLPEGLTVIPAYLFYSSGKLQQVNIPSTVTEIGESAFSRIRISGITLPDNLRKIGDHAFDSTYALDKVVLPDGIESIGSSAFNHCRLTEMVIPDSVTYMGEGVFQYSKIKACALPAGMKNIPDSTFECAYMLELVVLPENLQVIEEDAFSNCSKLKYVDLPDTVTRIERAAFWSCSGLEMIYIPSSVTYIGDDAFTYCNHENFVMLIPYSEYYVKYCHRYALPYYFNDRVSYIEYNPAKATLMVGQKYEPQMYIDFEDVDTITYSTSNKKVATVDSDGIITAKAAGTAKITATSKKGGAKATITITVKKAPSKVALNKKSIEMAVGGSATLVPTIPSGSATEYTWTSSNPAIATVANGKITAKATGQTTITVTTLNGKKASCVVTVRTAPTALHLEESLTMGVKQTITLKPVIEPEYAFQGLTFASSNSSVAQVTSAGKLTAKKAGTAVITVTTNNGIAKKMTVTVLAAPTKVKLNASKATMGAGQTGQLIATISPAAAYGEAVFTSSNSKVVMVDQQGNVTALKAGSATITAKTYNGKKATCKITVRKAPSAIALSATDLTLGVGEVRKLTASITKKTVASIAWTSSNPDVVKVSDGVITPVATGTAVITATTHNGKAATCKITVKPAPTGVQLSAESMTLSIKQKSAIGVTLLNGTGTDCAGAYTFKSSNTKIATVNSSGVVTGVKAGTATITVRTYDENVYAVCKVTVVPLPSKVKLSATKATLGAGETLQLTPSISPASSLTNYTFSSSKSSVAKVDQNGLVTAVKPGSATITVKTHNGKKATCKVTVKAAPTSLTLSAETMLLGVGQSGKLTAAITKNSATAFKINISDPSVISISGSKVTAKAVGTSVITVETFNGLKKSCTVTVKPAPTKLVIDPASRVMSVGQTALLDVEMQANGSTDCAAALTYKSSSTKVVTVSADGKLTAKRAGTATITVRSHNADVYAVCTVRVVAAPKKVALPTAAGMSVGETQQLTPVITPAASPATCTFTSSNPAVAKVAADGTVTAVSPGTATITVKTHNGKKAACKITVSAPAN